MRGQRGKKVPAMKSGTNVEFNGVSEGKGAHARALTTFEDKAEQAIVRGQKKMSESFQGNDAPTAADTRVDHERKMVPSEKNEKLASRKKLAWVSP